MHNVSLQQELGSTYGVAVVPRKLNRVNDLLVPGIWWIRILFHRKRVVRAFLGLVGIKGRTSLTCNKTLG